MQYEYPGSRNPEVRFSKSYYVKNDSLETSDSGWWRSGFYSVMLLYPDGANKNIQLQKLVVASLRDLKEQFNTSAHNLGFMM